MAIMFMNLRRKNLSSATSIGKMIEYFSREEAVDKENINNNELLNMINYYGREQANEEVDGGFSNCGNKPNETAVAELEYYRPKSVYQSIISFTPDDATNLGFEKKNDFVILAEKYINDACKIKGIQQKNVIWTGYLHVNTDHPHMHLYFFDKTKRLQDAILFTKKELKRLRSRLANNILCQVDKFELKDELLKKEIQNVHELIDTADLDVLMKKSIIARSKLLFVSEKNKVLIHSLIECAKILPERGKCTYNVLRKYNKEGFSKINTAVDLILKDSEEYRKYRETVYEIEKVYKTLYGDSKNDYAENQINNLRAKVANVVISQLKNSGAIKIYHQQSITQIDFNYVKSTLSFMCNRFNRVVQFNVDMMIHQIMLDAKRSEEDEKKFRQTSQ